MKRFLGIAAALVVVAIAGVMLYAATLPDVFLVRRSIAINAPPEKIFPLINDLRRWTAWSPYEKKDPAMKRTFGAASAGPGAVYEWDGDGSVGSGRMTITESASPSAVQLDLDMIRPIAAHNIVEFKLERKGDVTNVSWLINGAVPYPAKIIHVFFDMDTMIGRDFDAGLASLKAAAEK